MQHVAEILTAHPQQVVSEVLWLTEVTKYIASEQRALLTGKTILPSVRIVKEGERYEESIVFADGHHARICPNHPIASAPAGQTCAKRRFNAPAHLR